MHPTKFGDDQYFTLYLLNKFMSGFLVQLCFSGTINHETLFMFTSDGGR